PAYSLLQKALHVLLFQSLYRQERISGRDVPGCSDKRKRALQLCARASRKTTAVRVLWRGNALIYQPPSASLSGRGFEPTCELGERRRSHLRMRAWHAKEI